MKSDCNILGITSPMSWDSSACILKSGQLFAAAEEEKIIRIKHAPHHEPINSIDFCLKTSNLSMKDIDCIATAYMSNEEYLVRRFLYGLKYLSIDDLLAPYYYFKNSEHFKKLNSWNILNKNKNKLINVEHHLAHSFHSFSSSEFEKALVISLDGEGETVSGLISVFYRRGFQILHRIPLKYSLGSMYESFTDFIGYSSHYDEGKVMGLSSYGTANDTIVNDLVKSDQKCTFRIATRKINKYLKNKFEHLILNEGFICDELHKTSMANFAATAQNIYEVILLSMAEYWILKTKISNVCLAGGCSLNCLANGKLLLNPQVSSVFVPPGSNDAGTSIGAGVYAYFLNSDEIPYVDHESANGHIYSENEILQCLNKHNLKFSKFSNTIDFIARVLADGKNVGWFQGGIEFGPRALGYRSILSSADTNSGKDELNYIKGREKWRPFGCIILENKIAEYFEINTERLPDLRYMNVALPVRKNKAKQIPAVVHVDNTSRIQSVTESEKELNNLLKKYYEITGIPLLINTSFNTRGEPIVNTPNEAIVAFKTLNLDYLIMNDILVSRPNCNVLENKEV
ncbi:MAG: carbamoyltransferase C-terminal domain-containing protein [Candidatus Krumholzibacteriota bacterium]|nr:carbamoyltransferase C-terminal domain-containing protein [Candidatus Krumholzibacteriota bacterium]